jgi:hypothetical protein
VVKSNLQDAALDGHSLQGIELVKKVLPDWY